jgi:hypothetical protein
MLLFILLPADRFEINTVTTHNEDYDLKPLEYVNQLIFKHFQVPLLFLLIECEDLVKSRIYTASLTNIETAEN